MVKSVIIRF